ncbi:MAG: hypothetical protein ACK5M3_05500 [Dysgonomonas sp.]
MAHKWKPSKAQKREFANNMKDPDYAAAYYSRKEEKAAKKREESQFDYNTAGGNYVPTKYQHDFCFNNIHLFVTYKEKNAANDVMFGYSCNEKVHHDSIHIVNEVIRRNNYL